MSLYNHEKPWLFSVKGAIFILMGILTFVQIKNTLPILLLAFVALLIFNIVVRFAEAFVLKTGKPQKANIIVGVLSSVFLIWFAMVFSNFDFSAQIIDQSRNASYIVIVVWLIFASLSSFYEFIGLLRKKISIGYLFLVDAILIGLMAFLFNYAVKEAVDLSKALTVFGIYSFCVGIISLSLSKVLEASDVKE